jgi:rod shape-determining protein MreC
MRLVNTKYRAWVVYAGCTLASIAVFTSNLRGGEISTRLETGILFLMTPYYNSIDFVVEKTILIWQNYIYLVNLRDESDRLETELVKARSDISELREQLLASDRLSELLQLFPDPPGRRIMADVIRRSQPTWDSVFFVNAGTLDGAAPFMGVACADGVVGQVVEVSPRVSKIITLLHPHSGIAALLQQSRVSGVVSGTGSGVCSLKFASRFDRVILGETVITSGLDNAFPKGLPIGQVNRIERLPGDLFQRVEIIPFVDLPSVEEVVIFLPSSSESAHD